MNVFKFGILIGLVTLFAGCATNIPMPTTAPPAVNTSPAPSTLPAPSNATTKTGTLRFFDLQNLDVRDVPMRMALDDLKSQGYTVEITPLANSTLITEALARGEADLGVFNTQTAWTAITKGAPIRTVLQFSGATFVIAATSDITDCKDLDGKRVGLPTTSGTNPALLAQYLVENCDDAKPEFIVIPESAGRTAALLAGELDATMLPGEELIKIDAQAPGRFHALIPLSQAFSGIQVDALHAREEWIEQNPELLKDLIRAVLKANRSVIENPQQLYDEAVERLELDPATAKAIGDIHLQAKVWSPNGGLTEENMQNTLSFYQDNLEMDMNLTVESVADLSHLNAVLDEMGRK
jgi:ABC-type nitrate/sulfonate/bicarbonate transport system substrate-binding protein